MTDRELAMELLQRDVLRYPQWRDLNALIERNRNDGVFTQAEWNALRAYDSAWQAFMHARTDARALLKVEVPW